MSLRGDFFYTIHLSMAMGGQLGNSFFSRFSIIERIKQNLVSVIVQAPDLENGIVFLRVSDEHHGVASA